MFFLVGGELRGLAAKAVFCYAILIVNRDCPPDEHAAGLPLRFRDEVEAVVHAVDEIDVGDARLGEEGLRPGSALILIGVAGLVHPADVGLGLSDPDRQLFPLPLPDQIAPQQLPGHGEGVPVIKISGQDLHASSPCLCL